MTLNECIGKWVLRTKRFSEFNIRFMEIPILITNITDHHIMYMYQDSSFTRIISLREIEKNDENWNDGNWVEYSPATSQIVFRDGIPHCSHCGMTL